MEVAGDNRSRNPIFCANLAAFRWYFLAAGHRKTGPPNIAGSLPLVAKNGPPAARNRLPLITQLRTFPWPRLTSVVDPYETFSMTLTRSIVFRTNPCEGVVGNFP